MTAGNPALIQRRYSGIPSYIMFSMNRYIAVAAAIVVALILGVAALSMLDRPTEVDYRLAKSRAHLDAENYLAVLKTLRDLPSSQNRGPETHSYLGAAYLRLHLYQAAIKEFEEAVKLRPRRSDPWIGLASSYIELGDGQKAVDEAKRATDVEKGSADAWVTLGRAQWQQKDLDEAEKAGLKARELSPQNQAASDLLLHVYFDRNQPDKFQPELDRNPNPTKGIQDLAVRFVLRQGQFARAYELKTRYDKAALDRSILETELALQREPARMEQYPQYIRNLVRAGRFAEAIDASKRYRGAVALATITGDIQHWKEAYRAERIEQDYFILSRLEDVLPKASPMVRAFIYRYAGIFDASFYNKAAEEANHVLDQEPENLDALMTLGTAYHRLGRLDDATRYVELARQIYPKNAEPLSRLANLAVSRPGGDPPKIVDLMEQAVKIEPNNASYLFNLGWTYDQLGETKKAADLYQRAIRASPLSFEAMNNLALIYGSGGEPDRALPLLEQAVRTDPENEAVYFNFANYHVRRREWKPAIDDYDRVLQLNPANSAASIEKGRIFIELSRTEDALESLNHALEIDTHSFDAYILLSAAYEKMGHNKEAISAAEEAQRIRPQAPEVTAALDRLKDKKE